MQEIRRDWQGSHSVVQSKCCEDITDHRFLHQCLHYDVLSPSRESQSLFIRMVLTISKTLEDLRCYQLALSKVFESVLSKQLCNHFEAIGLLVGKQFGFLERSSCESAARQFLHVVKSNRGKLVGCLFIYLKKSLDTVDRIETAWIFWCFC